MRKLNRSLMVKKHSIFSRGKPEAGKIIRVKNKRTFNEFCGVFESMWKKKRKGIGQSIVERIVSRQCVAPRTHSVLVCFNYFTKNLQRHTHTLALPLWRKRLGLKKDPKCKTGLGWDICDVRTLNVTFSTSRRWSLGLTHPLAHSTSRLPSGTSPALRQHVSKFSCFQKDFPCQPQTFDRFIAWFQNWLTSSSIVTVRH